MFKLFKNKKPSINLLKIPNFNLLERNSNESIKEWINKEESLLLSVNFFDLNPDIPTTKDIDYLRQFYRDLIVQNNGGIIEVNIVTVCEIQSVKAILKIPQQPSGMIYLGTIIIPFKKFSYVVKIQANEFGTTGMRDSIVANKLMTEGLIEVGDEGYEGWFEDPYDSEYKKGTLMNKSELEKYDREFENHPLSILRQMFREIESRIELDTALAKHEKFEY